MNRILCYRVEGAAFLSFVRLKLPLALLISLGLQTLFDPKRTAVNYLLTKISLHITVESQ